MKILVSDKLADEGVNLLRKEGFEVDVKTDLKQEEIPLVIEQYEGLIIRSKTKVTAEVINAAKNLRIVLRAGTGLDNVDVKEATGRNIVVMNVPGGNTVSVAEHTIAMMFSLSRNIPQADASMKSGKWEKKKFGGVEINEKIIGIIGLGRIGMEVAKRARGLGMHVVGYDPVVSQQQAEQAGLKFAPLDELIKEADYITIHIPLTKETRHLIGEKELSAMKSGTRIINCARGGIVDEGALYNFILSGRIAGAALDVYENEPPDGSPLLGLENIIFTPHLGASTKEGQVRVAVEGVKQVVDFFKKGIARNAVNVPPIKIIGKGD